MNHELHTWEKKYKMFHKLFEQQNEIPDYQMYMADGFRENHLYSNERRDRDKNFRTQRNPFAV